MRNLIALFNGIIAFMLVSLVVCILMHLSAIPQSAMYCSKVCECDIDSF